MKKMIRERVEIARWVAAAITAASTTTRSPSPDAAAIGDRAWITADRICCHAEVMAIVEADKIRAAEEEERRKLEEEEAKTCRRPVADGFEGPCVAGPHSIEAPCMNQEGDIW